MIPQVSKIFRTVADVGSSIFGNMRSNQPAVEVPNITNIQTTNETADSGSERPMMQANPFAFTAPVATAIGRNLPAIGRALGLGGGAVIGANYLSGGDGEVCAPKSSAPYSVNKTSGCISVTRKQQARLKEMVSLIGLEGTAEMVGLDPNTLVMLLLKRFKARGRGITAASMKTTKRTIRQIKSLHAEVSSMAGRRSVVRRGSTTKTSIVKA
jgi:hypothetical protein